MQRAEAIGFRELEHGASDDCDAGVGAQVRELLLEPVRQRDVVGVEPRDVRAAGEIQRAVERAGEPQRVVVANDHEPRIVEGLENRGRPVARAVVDDDQLEILDRLAQDARDGVAQVALAVLHREENRDERSGLRAHGRTDDSLPPRGRGLADLRSHPRDGRPPRAAGAALRLTRATDSPGVQADRRRPERRRSRGAGAGRHVPSTCCTCGPSEDCHGPGTRAWLTCPQTSWPSPTTTASIPTTCSSGSRGASPPRRRWTASRVGRSAPTAARRRHGRPMQPCSRTTTSGTARSRSRSSSAARRSCAWASSTSSSASAPATPWSSGEEIDYLVRAVRNGARIAYDPQLTVTHAARSSVSGEPAHGRVPRRRERRLHPPQAPLSEQRRRAHARPPARRCAARTHQGRSRPSACPPRHVAGPLSWTQIEERLEVNELPSMDGKGLAPGIA